MSQLPTSQGELFSHDGVRITGHASHGKFWKHDSKSVSTPQSKRNSGLGNRMYDLTRSESCSMHASCFVVSRSPFREDIP